MRNASVSFFKAVKAGLLVGFLAAGVNNMWSFFAQLLGSEAPPGFALSVTVSSVLTMLVGALLYYMLVKLSHKGHNIFIVVAVIFTIVSLYPTITTEKFTDGTPVGEGFTLLTLPMHLIAGALGIWGIPKFSR